MRNLPVHLMTLLRRRLSAVSDGGGRERGASLVEYGLLLALFVVVTLAAIDSVQDSAGSRLSDTSETAGTPTELNGFYSDRSAPPTGGGGGETNPDPGSSTAASVSLGGGSASPGQGQRWDASITVTTSDGEGTPLPGVLVMLEWSGGKSGSAELVTGPNGTFTYTVEDIQQNQSSLTYTVVSVTLEGYDFATPYPSVTITKG
jgi:Flp pilus assembly pilin Flp